MNRNHRKCRSTRQGGDCRKGASENLASKSHRYDVCTAHCNSACTADLNFRRSNSNRLDTKYLSNRFRSSHCHRYNFHKDKRHGKSNCEGNGPYAMSTCRSWSARTMFSQHGIHNQYWQCSLRCTHPPSFERGCVCTLGTPTRQILSSAYACTPIFQRAPNVEVVAATLNCT